MYLDPENVFANLDAASSTDVLEKMGAHLLKGGYVRDSFVAAICERERIFPTGLPGRDFGIALPHADSSHVIRPGIAVANLPTGVPFQMMGTPDVEVNVRLVFMLLVESPDKQLDWLKNLMLVVKNHDLMQKLVDCDTSELLYNMLKKNL